MESYKILKKRLIEFRNNQKEKLKRLVINSWDCSAKLKDYIKLAEKILKLAEISRRLETEREKILPYYENSDNALDDIEKANPQQIMGIDNKLYDEIESLKFFWKRYNKVVLDMISIKKQKDEIEKQNDTLKSMLQQYYDGFTVNNVVMTNDNPLLIIEKSITGDGDYNQSTTMQEGAHIMMDIRRQEYNYNYIYR
jgi:hypothetical protein